MRLNVLVWTAAIGIEKLVCHCIIVLLHKAGLPYLSSIVRPWFSRGLGSWWRTQSIYPDGYWKQVMYQKHSCSLKTDDPTGSMPYVLFLDCSDIYRYGETLNFRSTVWGWNMWSLKVRCYLLPTTMRLLVLIMFTKIFCRDDVHWYRNCQKPGARAQ